MKNRLSSLSVLATLIAGAFIAAGCSSSSDATLTVENEESFQITQIYVNAVGDDNFADNLLGSQPLAMGESITFGVACDHYDVEIVDESGADCQVLDTDLCFNDSDWIINDSFCHLTARKDDGSKLPLISIPKTTAK
jgi:hypothetical protein